MSNLAIEVEGLVKHYGPTKALDGLNLTVPRGSLAGFAGLNGAGKSTTMRLLLQMAPADAGKAAVLGLNALDKQQNLDLRRRIAFVPERKDLFPYMSVSDVIAFTKSFYPKWRSDLEKHYMACFGLHYDQKIPHLSKGTQTKLHLLLALSRGAELILLDEPTDGLDPLGVEVALQALVGLAAEEGVTILISSHRLNELEQVADYLCLIHKGRSLLNGALDELKESCRRVVMVFDGDSMPSDREFALVGMVRRDGRSLTVFANGATQTVVERAQQLGARSVDVQSLSLREMFLELVKGEMQ